MANYILNALIKIMEKIVLLDIDYTLSYSNNINVDYKGKTYGVYDYMIERI